MKELSTNVVTFINCSSRVSVRWSILGSVRSTDIYRCESDRCCILPFFLSFLSFHHSMFSFYIKIDGYARVSMKYPNSERKYKKYNLTANFLEQHQKIRISLENSHLESRQFTLSCYGKFKELAWELLPHLHDLPDLAQSHFHLFPSPSIQDKL